MCSCIGHRTSSKAEASVFISNQMFQLCHTINLETYQFQNQLFPHCLSCRFQHHIALFITMGISSNHTVVFTGMACQWCTSQKIYHLCRDVFNYIVTVFGVTGSWQQTKLNNFFKLTKLTLMKGHFDGTLVQLDPIYCISFSSFATIYKQKNDKPNGETQIGLP